MHELGRQLLARAGLASDQNGAVCGGGTRQVFSDPLHHVAFTGDRGHFRRLVVAATIVAAIQRSLEIVGPTRI
jgi:hypothetical protein